MRAGRRARRAPRRRSRRARRSRRRRRRRRAPAGFASGPRTLKTVRTPSSSRTGATRRIAGWWAAGEHEAEAELVDRERDPLRRLLERDPERLEHVGRPGRGARGAVAVLCDGRACSRGHERGCRRDVERVRAVAARADDVDHGGARRSDGHDVLAHRLREAGDLVGGLALRAQRDEEAGDLRRRRLAVHDRAHQLVGVRAREVMPVEQQLDRGADDHREEVPRHRRPERRQHALGMELHALDRQLAVTHAHHLAVRRVRGHGELGGNVGRGERVVAPDLDLVRQPRVDAEAVVRDRARLAVQQRLRLARPRPRTPRRSPGGRGRRPASASSARARRISSIETPALSGRPGPGETTSRSKPPARASSTVIASFRTVTHLGAELLEQVHEVVGERVVVVEHQHPHGANSCSARSIAASSAASFLRHSSCSAAGSESATTRRPPGGTRCRRRSPSCAARCTRPSSHPAGSRARRRRRGHAGTARAPRSAASHVPSARR